MKKNHTTRAAHPIRKGAEQLPPGGRYIFPLWLVAGIIIAALAAVLHPLLQQGFFVSDDGEWMIIRLSAFYQSLADGQFPVRYLGRLNNSYGYPVANFLYPGFLYIGSFIRFLGPTFTDTIKIILASSVIAGACAVFWSLRAQYGRWPSVMGTLSFIFAPYLLYDLYHRGSVGEVFAMGVAAFVLLSLSRGWAWMFAPMVGLLIISHNTVAMLMGAVVLSLVLVHRFRTRFFISGALGVGLSAFFWLPAVVEKNLVRFDMVQVSDPSAYFITLANAGLLGLSVIISLAVMLRMKHSLTAQDKVITVWTTVGLLLSLPISMPFWQIQEFSALIQFPYRLLVIPVLLGPWIVSLVMEKLQGWGQRAFAGVLMVIWILGIIQPLTSIQFVKRSEGFYTTNEATTNVANEYMPRWVTDVPVNRPVETLEVISGDAVLSERTFSGERLLFTADAKVGSVVQINKVYYPGWGVTIDNRLIPIDYQNALGVMRIEIPQGSHTVTAQFRETPFRFAADLISFISLVIYLVLLKKLQKLT